MVQIVLFSKVTPFVSTTLLQSVQVLFLNQSYLKVVRKRPCEQVLHALESSFLLHSLLSIRISFFDLNERNKGMNSQGNYCIQKNN